MTRFVAPDVLLKSFVRPCLTSETVQVVAAELVGLVRDRPHEAISLAETVAGEMVPTLDVRRGVLAAQGIRTLGVHEVLAALRSHPDESLYTGLAHGQKWTCFFWLRQDDLSVVACMAVEPRVHEADERR